MIENELQECSEENVFCNMIIVCASVTKNEDYEDGSKQPSTKQQEDSNRKLCTLNIYEETWKIILQDDKIHYRGEVWNSNYKLWFNEEVKEK